MQCSRRAPPSRIVPDVDIAHARHPAWFGALADPLTLGGFAHTAVDVVSGDEVDLVHGVALEPHGFVWLRIAPL